MHTFRGIDVVDGPLRPKVIPSLPKVPRGWLPPSFIDCIYLIVKLTVTMPFFRGNVRLYLHTI